jgi:hypothetical protein
LQEGNDVSSERGGVDFWIGLMFARKIDTGDFGVTRQFWHQVGMNLNVIYLSRWIGSDRNARNGHC